MKDYLMELAKLSGKCLVVFIFAFVFINTTKLRTGSYVALDGGIDVFTGYQENSVSLSNGPGYLEVRIVD